MHNGLKYLFTFALGTAAGSAVAWKLLKTKYERIAQEEIESVKETFERLSKSDEEACGDVDDAPLTPTEQEKNEYRELVGNYAKGGSEPVDIGTPPYMITYEEFNEIDEYDACTLIYYADGVLADDSDDIVEDVDNVVGREFASHFDEDPEDPDIVYVRNDRLKTDYEICRDAREYAVLNPTDNA